MNNNKRFRTFLFVYSTGSARDSPFSELSQGEAPLVLPSFNSTPKFLVQFHFHSLPIIVYGENPPPNPDGIVTVVDSPDNIF